MNDRQRQTEFLRQCLRYDDSSDCRTLAERIRQLQHNERCVRRALWFMMLLAALAFAALGYLAIFLEDFPQNMPGFMGRFITQVICVVGLSSLICIPVFVGLEVVYRNELDQQREQCRRVATQLLESRLGKPRAMAGSRVVQERELIAPVVSSPDREVAQREAGGVIDGDQAHPAPMSVAG